MGTLEVRFNQGEESRRIQVPLVEGERLLDQIVRSGVPLAHDCGGVLACASCAVVVHEGAGTLNVADEDEQDMLDKAALDAAGARLSCRAIVGAGDLVIEVPQADLPPAPPATLALAVVLSERAAKHLLAQLAKRPRAAGVRLSVRPAGCSGMRYQLDYADAFDAGDAVFDNAGVRIAVDPGSLPFVQGTRVDFVAEGLASRLRFHNPNVCSTCGCGESFGMNKIGLNNH
jgi:iron-sulfur cluster assembly protein